MTENEIRNRAERYMELEKNTMFRKEIQDLLLSKNMEELHDRFWRNLDFGTGGLRGVIGGGDNRMNTYNVRRATQGLANYIISRMTEEERGVAISYDSRRFSAEFAEEAAMVLAANGIRVWLFTSLRPTPILSYTVRKMGASAGIMVTASHNPAKYNGYKVFWADGAQVVAPHDTGIIAEVLKVSGPVPAMDRKEAEKKGLLIPIDREIDTLYCNMVVNQSLNPDMIKADGSSLKVVYSPLHGAGTIPVERTLNSLGIKVITVPEQREPDGNFPTVAFPNPEIAPALKMALDLGTKEKADLVMATDPDADRLGIAVPDGKDWLLMSGNRLGALLADYIFRVGQEQGRLPTNPAFVNTIVTSELQNKIAESYGAANFRVLTGFKYIGEKIREFEAANNYSYVFGGEESYGYLVGTEVRDKDAVSAAAMTAEMTLWNRRQGRTLMDHLAEIWRRFGYYDETLISRDFEGQSGQKSMNLLMKKLRTNPPKSIADIPLNAVRDFKTGETLDTQTEKREKNIHLPSSDVLQFVLADGSLVSARPSGTEPKIKFYASCRSEKGDNLPEAKRELKSKISGIEEWINTTIASIISPNTG